MLLANLATLTTALLTSAAVYISLVAGISRR
jgi:hypothetical protein